MPPRIKVAMLGMGNMGRAHADNLRKLEGVEIAALCSLPIADALRYNADRGANYPVYDDFDAMLSEREADALYVCLPPFAHAGQIERAAEKGVHLFVEKPLALSVERARRMEQAVRRAGVLTQMGYQMRFGGAVRHVRRLMEQGVTGKPTLFTANYECNSLHAPWWIDRAKCGGQVFEQVIHLYDMALHLMGRAELVSGFLANLCHRDVPGYTVEDTSSVAIRFLSGALGSITGSNCAEPGKWKAMFKVVYENLVAVFEDCNSVRLIHTKPEVREEALRFSNDVRFDEDAHFISVLRGEKPEFAPVGEGLLGLEMVGGAVASSEKGGMPVRV